MNAGFARPGKASSLNRMGFPILPTDNGVHQHPAGLRQFTYTDSLTRPFWRRRASTLRPSAVFIRFRNPCFRLRFFVDG